MVAKELEPEMEELLLRLVPDLANKWQGATEEEINQIEQISGRPLPKFYRWFLMRMGQGMGPISYPLLDFSSTKVLTCYAEELFVPMDRFFMIGYNADEAMPLHIFYDLDYQVRDDSRVVQRHSEGGTVYIRFETFREMIAWGKVVKHGMRNYPERCRGIFVDVSGNVLSHLGPVMESLGFNVPIQTGPCCAIYEGKHATLVSSCTPSDRPNRVHVFELGGSDSGSLRRILGEITIETSLELEVQENDPRRLRGS